MSVKEYDGSGVCDTHTSVQLIKTGGMDCDDWYECPTCRKEDWVNFHKFLDETSKKMDLRPVWKGGRGLGVTCPCCKGEGYVPK